MTAKTEAVLALVAALTQKITQSKAELDAQAIGNALYGLQNMTADTWQVRAVLIAIETKYPDSLFSMTSDPLEWCQAVAATLRLVENSTDKQVPILLLKKLFPGQSIEENGENLMQIKRFFVEALWEKHWNKTNNTLDLHGLDHLSADYLLEYAIKKEVVGVCAIIAGIGSHSTPAHRFSMHQKVEHFLRKNNIVTGTWDAVGGRITFPRSTPALSGSLATIFNSQSAPPRCTLPTPSSSSKVSTGDQKQASTGPQKKDNPTKKGGHKNPKPPPGSKR